MLCNLCCLKARMRLLCNKLLTAQQPEPRFKAVKLCNIFIFRMAYLLLKNRRNWYLSWAIHPTVRIWSLFLLVRQATQLEEDAHLTLAIVKGCSFKGAFILERVIRSLLVVYRWALLPHADHFWSAIVWADYPIVMWLKPIVLSSNYCSRTGAYCYGVKTYYNQQ